MAVPTETRLTARYRAVVERVTAAEVTELTRQLVRIPSVYRPGVADADERAVATEVASWLRSAGFAVSVEEVAPGRPNVIGVLEGDRPGPTLCLEGHTDVVTEGDPREWTYPPFAGTLVGGRIYGRGAADMKGGLAAAMVGAAALRRAGASFAGKLVVAALCDEEGGMIGARHFARSSLGRQVTGAIICEPEENELCLEQKGVVWVRIRIQGRMAHGAMPYAGLNPIAAAGRLVAALPGLERRLRRGVRPSRFLGPPYLTPTICRAPIAGEPQANVIPSAAEVLVDARLVPGLEPDGVLAGLSSLGRDAEAAWPGLRVEVEPLAPARPATRMARGEPVVRALAWAIRAVTGRAPRWGGVPGSTDGTVLHVEAGIPIVTCGPGNRRIPHQVDEYVEVSELEEAARCYAAAALRYLRPVPAAPA